RHGGDLPAVANALGKLAIELEPGAQVEPANLTENGATKLPEPFEIAESLARGTASVTIAHLTRALGSGRDCFEILAVEFIPALRRMILAASMLAARKSPYEIAGALGFGPQSSLATRAIDGAKRLGLARLTQAYRRVAELDAGFKNGEVKNREEA